MYYGTGGSSMNDTINVSCGSILENELTEEELSAFLNYLDEQADYLDTGLGAFHTDNHSNW